jgi:hypothetical protein
VPSRTECRRQSTPELVKAALLVTTVAPLVKAALLVTAALLVKAALLVTAALLVKAALLVTVALLLKAALVAEARLGQFGLGGHLLLAVAIRAAEHFQIVSHGIGTQCDRKIAAFRLHIDTYPSVRQPIRIIRERLRIDLAEKSPCAMALQEPRHLLCAHSLRWADKEFRSANALLGIVVRRSNVRIERLHAEHLR